MKTKTTSAFLLVIILACVVAGWGQPKPPQKGQEAASAEKWLENLRAQNRGKWNEDWFMTGQIRYLSEFGIDSLSAQMKTEKDDCKRAVENVAHAAAFQNFVKGAFHDMGKGVVLVGKEIAESLSPANTIKKLLIEAGKKGAEWLIKYLRELLAKEKAEVHITHANRENCQLVFVSIWDKAASRYEVIIYGNCGCAPLNSFSERGKVKVNTFEIHLGGKAILAPDETNENLVLKGDVPDKVTIGCDVCKANAPVVPAPKSPVETTPKPDPPKPDPPTTSTNENPCKPPPPPCPECKLISDKIVAACDRIKEIDNDVNDRINPQVTPREERVKKGTATTSDKQELEQFNTEKRQLLAERTKLQTEIANDTAKLKTCEKDRCGKTVTGPSPTTGPLDPCLVGKWKATKVDMISRYRFVGGTGFTVTFSRDGTQEIDYSTMAPLVNVANESYTFRGTAAGKITTQKGVAKISSIERTGVKVSIVTVNDPSISYVLKNLGPGALGSTASDNGFTCTNDTLEYITSWIPSGLPSYHVILTRVRN